MRNEQQKQHPGKEEEQEEEEEDSQLLESPLPLTVTSRVLYMLGDIASGPAFKFTQWLQLVRKRTSKFGPSGFPNRLSTMPSFSPGEAIEDATSDQTPKQTEVNLWERLGKAEMLDIESSMFSWERLASLHHTEHSSINENSEDEMNKALEVTVNSGGVVFFAFFNGLGGDNALPKEAAAVIKISSSRLATQSERLGYEFARWLGVRTPQARVIHNTSSEWLQIKEATEKARDAASSKGDESGEMTCSELLEALELGRCLYFMSYVHGSPLLESSSAFESREIAERTSAALGRVLMLDLVIRNEDRLPCRQLRWRGNSANLLFAEKLISANTDTLGEAIDSAMNHYGPRVVRALQNDRRSASMDSKPSSRNPTLISQRSDVSDIVESAISARMSLNGQTSAESRLTNFNVVAIDSGVPRRPPTGKRADDQTNYPKLVELLLNSSEFSSNLLYDITGGKLGCSAPEDIYPPTDVPATASDLTAVHEFRCSFRAALRDLQGFYIFLLTLHQKLDNMLRLLMNIISKISSLESEKDEFSSPIAVGSSPSPSPTSRERFPHDNHQDLSDSESQKTAPRISSSSGGRDCCDSGSASREGCHGKHSRGSSEPHSGLRITAKLRDFNKFAKVDAESSKELEQWNEMLKNEVIKLCQDNNFNTGFFEGSEDNCVIDAYELKVRLEHILERIVLISEAANTEKPSAVTNTLYVGGALAARSVYTLQRLGITHILCLCTNEIGQADSQFPDLFTYKNFSVSDNEDCNISSIFEEACDFIDYVEQIGQRVLVHCFEGRSRSVTLVLAYLMLRKKFTLLEAWTTLKRVHRRAQPNDGFAKILQELDKKLHGKVSMEWQQRKPTMKVCPMCGKNAGLSSSSLKLHLQKFHKKLSSGSVDSAMTMEIQKALTALKISRGGSVSPIQRQSQSMIDE
ncbi:Very-long-chain (3R)-3-hydroxyacyl-CoA dehydratase [Stylosanthes scabra]|uniref:Very-long-chain (3R)-3-hydroxyacyl-CoA dehydratase n=1 Tax=Stylosanthes scabra TaxID=79078 RepID=A0ABU6XAA2_9FABA|nr:Very-long-chain (3R)-3-hydroxyacyl-CoA dehydratase [Stylosanthes scabra]